MPVLKQRIMNINMVTVMNSQAPISRKTLGCITIVEFSRNYKRRRSGSRGGRRALDVGAPFTCTYINTTDIVYKYDGCYAKKLQGQYPNPVVGSYIV
jgi:hypothetical protein